MDKRSQKVTKDPKRQERGKKSHETYMKRLKDNILREQSAVYLFLYRQLYTFYG